MGNPTLRIDRNFFQSDIYPTRRKLFLPENDEFEAKYFLEIYRKRRSNKVLHECLLKDLSLLLRLALKPCMIGKDDTGTMVLKCASPSGGGRFPVDILVGIPIDGKRDLYYYNTIDNSLNLICVANKLKESFFQDVNNTLDLGNATLLWFSIQTDRTSSKYLCPESIYWRDAGALLYCLQLTCSYVGLGSCPIGYLAENTFFSLFRKKNLLSGGGLLIGNLD